MLGGVRRCELHFEPKRPYADHVPVAQHAAIHGLAVYGQAMLAVEIRDVVRPALHRDDEGVVPAHEAPDEMQVAVFRAADHDPAAQPNLTNDGVLEGHDETVTGLRRDVSEQVIAARTLRFQRSKIRYTQKYFGRGWATMLRLFLWATFAFQWLEEATKWLIGHRRSLRRERIAAYGQVLREL